MPAPDVTTLLIEWRNGSRAALDELIPCVHEQLRRIAHRQMRAEAPGHDLQTTALINEAYLRLVDIERIDFRDRAHFLAVSARLMRRILVDAARARRSLKRGGGGGAVSLDDVAVVAPGRQEDMLAIDEALTALAQLDPRKAQVVELRFFGGLTVEQSAEVLQISADSVMRDWRLARVWLLRRLTSGASDAP